ncbi:MAG TPA: hypothetical protein VFI37_08415 [Gaiellaceae bacterium]|nr:hypothetical protein [Gaiellaceae bacterium]
MTFPDLVRAHKARIDAPDDADAAAAYTAALAGFERREGTLEGTYWCSDVASAAAVTVRGRVRCRRRFHRATAWAARPEQRISALLNECDELGVRVAEVLRGTSQRIAIGLVLRVAGNLLALVDERTAHPEREQLTAAAKLEAANLTEAQEYYRRAARRQAQLVYVFGMLVGVLLLMGLVLAILAVVHWTADVRWIPHDAKADQPSLSTLYLCAISGALGANVSVASRIDENAFKVDFELGRFTIAALGALRPLLGAVFGIALCAALASGLLDLFKVPDQDLTQQLYFFLVIAFLAGFSERWTKGILVGIEGGAGAVPPHESKRAASSSEGAAGTP